MRTPAATTNDDSDQLLDTPTPLVTRRSSLEVLEFACHFRSIILYGGKTRESNLSSIDYRLK